MAGDWQLEVERRAMPPQKPGQKYRRQATFDISFLKECSTVIQYVALWNETGTAKSRRCRNIGYVTLGGTDV